MAVAAGVIILVIIIVLMFRRRGDDARYARRRKGGLIGRRGHVRSATYCECGKLKAICRRDEARDTHAEGMLGKKKLRKMNRAGTRLPLERE